MRLPAEKAARIALMAVGVMLALARAQAQESDAHAHMHETHDPSTRAAHARASEAAETDKPESAPQSATDHVTTPPPQHAMESMSNREMTDAMEMNDAAPVAMLRFDRLERVDGDDGIATAWKFAATVGGDFDKLLVRSEGEHAHGAFERSDAEALWSHAVASYWDTQVGVRRDFGRGADRTWAAFGVQGLAPYRIEVGATVYVGDAGRSALRVEADYDLSLTQRLILQPRVELNAYGRSDPAAHVGSGLSDAEAGLRLRYEIRREFALYVGLERSWLFGEGADFTRGEGLNEIDTTWVVGVRLWY
jgi:copper resistance protein B